MYTLRTLAKHVLMLSGNIVDHTWTDPFALVSLVDDQPFGRSHENRFVKTFPDQIKTRVVLCVASDTGPAFNAAHDHVPL